MATDPQPRTRPEPGDDERTRVFNTPETTGQSTESTNAGPANAGPTSTEPDRRGPRVGTVVWGLVIAAVGVGILALTAGLVFDIELALITLIAAAGAALLIGSLVTGVRRSGR